ncbi:MAG: polyphosphate kinase 2 family protein [Phaeodactylibacter sp.]|nr:polyphosphate kinase 2 family protein [Phaeodactylibacter sp.]MCB9264254.1 polyphosphate kinase 2 family protein [Lewinellaceae bacterium]MCB9291228.1 polyphosphate kinase 2 family protein [Lewinellaceae bacterium]
MSIDTQKFRVAAKKVISLKDYDPGSRDGFKNKKSAKAQLREDIGLMSELQYRLYAENRQALLIIFQAMDAAGKDSAIRHVLSGINPQGCEVHSFKHPSTLELEHDYLWRHYSRLPDRGRIGIFNRSHYENVLITKVHPEFLLAENLPGIHSVKDVGEKFWKARYRQINNFERTISENGTTIIKFFLHLSKKEQKKRFLERIEKPEKNWKFSAADIEERAYWDDYQKAYETAISKTSTEFAPWYVIPADHKWFSRMAIGNIIVETLKRMNIKMPVVSEKEKILLQQAKERLEKE